MHSIRFFIYLFISYCVILSFFLALPFFTYFFIAWILNSLVYSTVPSVFYVFPHSFLSLSISTSFNSFILCFCPPSFPSLLQLLKFLCLPVMHLLKFLPLIPRRLYLPFSYYFTPMYQTRSPLFSYSFLLLLNSIFPSLLPAFYLESFRYPFIPSFFFSAIFYFLLLLEPFLSSFLPPPFNSFPFPLTPSFLK